MKYFNVKDMLFMFKVGNCVILILVLMVPCVGILNTDPVTFHSLRSLRYFLNPFSNVLFFNEKCTLKIERAALSVL